MTPLAAMAIPGIASLPFWLPRLVIFLRTRIFIGINGEEGIAVPGPHVDVSRFKEVYGHPAANGRSRGAELSDLFWYWLAPGPEMHQEHLEAGPRYETVAQTTREILSDSKKTVAEGTALSIENILAEQIAEKIKIVRLRDLMMPVWADFYYRLVFKEECPKSVRELITGNATDVINALKMTRPRHMERRHRLTQYLVMRLKAGDLAHILPAGFTILERAYYLQGTFFNTAVVQTSEAMTHLLLFLAQNPRVQSRLFDDPSDERYLEQVITESLRVHPLFGIAHRITTADITGDALETIPRGSVLCFNYTAYHHAGYTDPKTFAPERWIDIAPRDANYLAFGSPTNRPCPAQGVALAAMRAATREVVKRVALFSSVAHTRSMANRGPCLLVARPHEMNAIHRKAQLLLMRVRDQWEDVGRSLLQLILGTYMIGESRRLRLCQTHFDGKPPDSPEKKSAARPSKCPFARWQQSNLDQPAANTSGWGNRK